MVYYTCEGWLSTDARGAWLTVNLWVKELVDWLLFVEKLTLLFVASIFTHGKIDGKSGHLKSLLPQVLSWPILKTLPWCTGMAVAQWTGWISIATWCWAFNIFQLHFVNTGTRSNKSQNSYHCKHLHTFVSCLWLSVEELLLFNFVSSSSAESLKPLILSTTEHVVCCFTWISTWTSSHIWDRRHIFCHVCYLFVLEPLKITFPSHSPDLSYWKLWMPWGKFKHLFEKRLLQVLDDCDADATAFMDPLFFLFFFLRSPGGFDSS